MDLDTFKKFVENLKDQMVILEVWQEAPGLTVYPLQGLSRMPIITKL